MPATEVTLLLDRTGQQQPAGRRFLQLFCPAPSSFMLCLSTLIFDLILRKRMFWSSHALCWLVCCKLSQSGPFRGPHALTMPQCHTHGSYFVFIFLWQLHHAHVSEVTDHSEGQWPIWVLGDHFLKLSFGFIKALQCEVQLKELHQGAAMPSAGLLFQMFAFRSSAWTPSTQALKWNYPENLNPVSSRR